MNVPITVSEVWDHRVTRNPRYVNALDGGNNNYNEDDDYFFPLLIDSSVL